jgi:hypothetical protein
MKCFDLKDICDALPENMAEPEKESYLYWETFKINDGQIGIYWGQIGQIGGIGRRNLYLFMHVIEIPSCFTLQKQIFTYRILFEDLKIGKNNAAI